MSVDMHEYKVLLQLRELPPFTPARDVDRSVRQVDFPAWRALFTSSLLWGHSTGYRLPAYDDFARYCKNAYTHDVHGGRFDRWFAEHALPLTDQRLRFWYESGLAETYLYACLVDALEDILRDGLVLYDPRADWKLKCDIAVVTRGARVIVDSFWGEHSDRVQVTAAREAVERERKLNTAASSHWGNRELERWSTITVARSARDCQVVNGVRLFSIAAVNEALKAIYDLAGNEQGERFFFPEGDAARRALYYEKLVASNAPRSQT